MATFVNLATYKKKFLIVRITNTYKPCYSNFQIYECSRGYWALDLERAEKVDYIISVYNAEIKGVYEAAAWLPANSTFNSVLPVSPAPEGRYEFVGREAKNPIIKSLVGNIIQGCNSKGNPVTYCDRFI